MEALTSVGAAVLLVGILVFIHESGHFLFAKLFGVGVHVFSLGFGRRLFGVVYKGTDYRVSALPLGGYVMMEGADPFQDGGGGDHDPDSPTSFLNQPVWQRLIIVAAGPAFNLILPVVVFTALYMAGQPQVASVVGQVELRSAAAESGLLAEDAIVAMDGEEVSLWTDLYPALARPPGAQVTFTVNRAGRILDIPVTIPDSHTVTDGEGSTDDLGLFFGVLDTRVGIMDPASPFGKAGVRSGAKVLQVDNTEVVTWYDLNRALDGKKGALLRFQNPLAEGEDSPLVVEAKVQRAGWAPPELPYADPFANEWGIFPGMLAVGAISEGSAAEAANVLKGDRLFALAGKPMGSWDEILSAVAATAPEEQVEGASAEPLEVVLVRNGRVIEQVITPQVTEDTDALGAYRLRPMLGIGPAGSMVYPNEARRYYSLTEAVPKATETTWMISVLVVETVGKLVTGEAAPSKTLGGPVQIVRDAAAAAKAGIFTYARMMAGLSISLGIINFLPVPVLDGGQFLFYLVEGIRGRPLSLAIRERAQQVGVLFLVGLMVAVFIMDVNRWLTG